MYGVNYPLNIKATGFVKWCFTNAELTYTETFAYLLSLTWLSFLGLLYGVSSQLRQG